jgi:hypothetical protein
LRKQFTIQGQNLRTDFVRSWKSDRIYNYNKKEKVAARFLLEQKGARFLPKKSQWTKSRKALSAFVNYQIYKYKNKNRRRGD